MSSLCFAHRKFGLILLLLIVSAICPSRVQAASLNLTWTDTSGNEAGFKIERSTNGGTFTQIATVSAGVTSYTDPGLVAGTMYCYQVRAYNSGGTSNPSNQACTIATEGNGDVPVGDSSLRLSWADTSGNEDGFKMERLNGSAFTQIATVGANVTSYTDSGLVAGKTYCYRVRAYNSGGTSDPSNQACANATDSNGSVVVDGSAGGSTSGDSTGIEDSTPAKESDSAQQVGAQWKDYRVTLKMLSTDNDAIGVMFRYVDNRNYYRFSWNTEEKYRRLEKFQNGKRTILAEDAVRYASGRTYKLQIVAQGTTLQVRIDDSPVFSVTDSSLEAGTVALYSWYNAGSVFDDLLVENLPTGETLLWNDFNNDASFLGWTIVDEGPSSGPSEWFVDKGVLNQTGNIGGGSDKPGTFAVYVKSNWTDYRASLKVKSTDNDAIGVMFRYVDNRNYYRFSWNTEEKYRRLEKFQNGKRTILAEDAVRYASGRTYKLQIVAQGTTLQVRIDDSPVFSVTDSSLEAGTVALYSWYNAGSVFDDLLVENLPTGETLLWNDFNNDASFLGWTIVDEGPSSGPSEWFVDKGVLNQTGNIGAGSDKPGTFAVFKTY